MQQTMRWMLIGIGVVLLLAAAAYAYLRLREPPPQDAGLVAQAEAACLSNIRNAEAAKATGGGKLKDAEGEVSGGIATETSRDRGAGRDLPPEAQLSENDKVRACMQQYLRRQATPSGPGGAP